MHNAEEEPRLFDATLAYDDDSKQSTTDIFSAWGPFFYKILIDIIEEEHVHKFLWDSINVQDVEKRMLLSSPIREVKLKYENVRCWSCVFLTTLK